MQTYNEKIVPGSALKITITGAIFYVKSSSAGEVLAVEFVNGQAQGQRVSGVGKGFKAVPVSRFDGLRLTASVETQVEFIVSDGEIDFAFNTDEIVIGNTDSQALPVRVPDGEALQVRFDNDINIGVVQVENNLVTIVDAAAITIGTVAASISNDPTLKKIRMRNMSDDALIAIGGANVALGSPIILQPGEMYFEDDAAGAHLYAIADSDGATLVIQGLK